MKHSVFCLPFLIVMSSMAPAQQGGAVDLLILAGQSNMIGRAPATATVPGVDPIDALVDYYYDVEGPAFGSSNSGGQLIDLAPWQSSSGGSAFGPEISLGRILGADPNRHLAILKVAVGATNIAQWLPGRGQYNRLQKGVRDGIEALQAEGHAVNILGFTWMQGEHDQDQTNAPRYFDNLSNLIGGR